MRGSDILLLAPSSAARAEIAASLSLNRHRFDIAEDDATATARLAEKPFAVVIAELARLTANDQALLREMGAMAASPQVVVLAQTAEVPRAVELVEQGARTFVTPPFSGHELRRWVARLADEPFTPLRPRPVHGVLGSSSATHRVLRRLEAFAASEHAVSIRGESGTPRALFAETLHARGARASGPFVGVPCGSVPEAELERGLFGDGGWFERAAGGTMHLQGLETLSLRLQARLAEVLTRREAGGRRLDARFVVSAPIDLALRVSRGEFREDLYDAIDVLDLEIPPLRERRLELPFLVETQLRRLEPRGPKTSITPRALVALAEYPFPGNDLELEVILERALLFSAPGAPIDLERFTSLAAARIERGAEPMLPLTEALRNFERDYLVRALNATGGHKRRTAERLGVSRKSLWKKLRALGVSSVDYVSGEAPRVGETEHDTEDEMELVEGEEDREPERHAR